MSEKIGELISATVDGEASESERSVLLRHFREDPDARGQWERYHLISDAMRHNLPADPCHDLATRVGAALESEPTILAPRAKKSLAASTLKPVGGLAIAASVALVAVFGVRFLNVQDSTPVAQVASVPEFRAPIQTVGTRWNLAQPAVENKLNSYLVNHFDYAPARGMSGMLPYASVVGYDASR